MDKLTPKIGLWAAIVFSSLGLGMLIVATGGRRHAPRQWADQAGIDLDAWLALGGIFLVGGLVLLAICRWPAQK
ncbi:MAG: hypothetical protein QM608_18255 [Caulobacter sp.]